MHLNICSSYIFAALFAGYLASNPAHALSSDKEQAIHFAARQATLDQKNGITTYTGDVEISQGTLRVKADRVTAHFNAETQKLEKIHAEGSPARYEQQPDANQGTMVIEARTVTALFENSTQRVEKIQAEGSPARYQQQPSLDKGVISANANNISYTPRTEQLLLLENASLEQDGASMSANRIVYDILKEVMQAAGDSNSDQQRIEIIIPPQLDLQD